MMRQSSLHLPIVLSDCFLVQTKPPICIDHMLGEPGRPICHTVYHPSLNLFNFSLRNTAALFIGRP
jgi:hypothetical protein